MAFEFGSRIELIQLVIPSEFGGDRIEIPDSVTDLCFRIDSEKIPPLVVSFGPESRLQGFKSFDQRGFKLRNRGVFERFSEKTLKLFRETNNSTYRVCGVTMTTLNGYLVRECDVTPDY
jgi:hypothetical protein